MNIFVGEDSRTGICYPTTSWTCHDADTTLMPLLSISHRQEWQLDTYSVGLPYPSDVLVQEDLDTFADLTFCSDNDKAQRISPSLFGMNNLHDRKHVSAQGTHYACFSTLGDSKVPTETMGVDHKLKNFLSTMEGSLNCLVVHDRHHQLIGQQQQQSNETEIGSFRLYLNTAPTTSAVFPTTEIPEIQPWNVQTACSSIHQQQTQMTRESNPPILPAQKVSRSSSAIQGHSRCFGSCSEDQVDSEASTARVRDGSSEVRFREHQEDQ